MRYPTVAILLTLFSFPVAAQEFRATLQGTINDQTGSAVPRAGLSLTNEDTGVERKGESSEGGHYIFQFLQPGRYRLTVSATGFKGQIREGIELALGQNQRLDIAMELGAVSEAVEVTAGVPLVQTEETTLGAVIRSEIKDSLPLKGRSSLFMFTLAPGVVNNRYGEDTRPNDTITNVLFSANGSPVAATDVAVDGAINTVNVNRDVNISQWVPAVDSVAEFKLQMGTISAEFGRSAGSMMNIVIKSGTNSFHGTAYNYLRNSALDAMNFFSRGSGQKQPAFQANTFGGTLGGPVIRNRTFFFFSYEGAREGNGIGRTANVPTALMRRGDFSELPQAIYDPFSVTSTAAGPVRTPFPGRVIPSSRLDPVGAKLVTFLPEANTAPPNPRSPWLRNFTFTDKWPRDYNTYVGKIDHQFSDSWTTYFRFNYGNSLLIFPHEFDGIASRGRNVVNRPHKGFSWGNTKLLNARTTFDLRIGAAWGMEKQRPFSDGYDLSSLGYSESFVNLTQSRAFPQVNFAGGLQGMANSGFLQQPGYSWFLQPSMTLARGRHLFKAGGEGRLLYGNFFRNPAPSGTFTFSNAWTDGPRADTPQANTGFPIASLLVGLGSGNLPFNTGVSIVNKYYGFYLQDDLRLTSKLSFNLGIRYEYETPRTERYDRATRGFCRTCPSPLQVPGMNLSGGLQFAGVDGPRGIYNSDRNNISPRFGLAYSFNPKTVVRLGYSLYYLPIVGSVNATGYDSSTPWVVSQDGITPKDRLGNPFPDGRVPAIGNTQGLGTLVGQSVAFIEPSDVTPRFHTWHLNIQRGLPSQGVFEIGYVGSRSLNIANDPSEGLVEQLNQLDPSFMALGTQLTQVVDNPFFGRIPSGPLAGARVQRQQLLRPYPQFLNVTRQRPAFGASTYHALQMRYQKRLSAGMAAIASYTFSRLIGDVSTAQNANNRRAERAPLEFDAPHRLTTTFSWDLPFGRDRKWLGDSSRLADVAVGGWKISMFNTFQSGLPLTFSTNRSTIFAIGAGGQRPDVVGDPSEGFTGPHGQRLDRFFNTAAFRQPANFTFGNAAARITSVRRPGMNNFNLALEKLFTITERVQLQFRAASYNLLNHPVFNAPNTSFGAAAFGQITSQANLSRQTEFVLRLRF